MSPRTSGIQPDGKESFDLTGLVGSGPSEDFDPVVRIVGEYEPSADRISEDMMFMDIMSPKQSFGPDTKPVGPEPPSNRLSDRGSDVSGKNSSFARGKSSSGSDVVMFSKSAMAKINGLAQIIESNPDAFKKTKVKKNPNSAYTVMVNGQSGAGHHVLMEASPVPDDSDSAPMYQCGYCQSIKTSSSAGADGRVRIRCECGGKHQDGKSRMHANWNPLASRPGAPIPALGNARLMAKGNKMRQNNVTYVAPDTLPDGSQTTGAWMPNQ